MKKNLEKREQIKDMLKKGNSRREIVKELKASPQVISECNKELKQALEWNGKQWELGKDDIKKLELLKNLTPKQVEEILYHNAIATNTEKKEIITEEIWHALFGAISDTHLWSKYCNYKGLEKYYNECKNRWIKTVFHSWDMVDWFGVYKWQTFELAKHSMQEQIDDVVNNYPKVDWIDTYFIGWNHDEAWLKIAWYDIWKAIDSLRDDLHYLWFYNARIKLNWVDIELHHPWWWQSYAWSYKLQKTLENTDPKNQPNVFLQWHLHTALYMFYRKIHAFMAGAFQGETLLAKRFKLGNVNWWWIIEVSLDNKGWTIINMEFIKV